LGKNGSCQKRTTKKGINVKIEQLDEHIKALATLEPSDAPVIAIFIPGRLTGPAT
jgi:hypothetical protein